MIDLNTFQIFTAHLTNLKETSLDNRDGQPQYMTLSNRSAYNFDAVKEEYVSSLGVSEIPKSNDALFDDGGGYHVFVEFKNGFMDRGKQFAVRKKIYDSALIFTDITSTGISYMRNHMKYILVYNEVANRQNTQDITLKEKQKAIVQPSASFDSFAKNVGKLAKEEYICFGLKIFQNYCFKEVHTYTEAEFDAYLSTL